MLKSYKTMITVTFVVAIIVTFAALGIVLTQLVTSEVRRDAAASSLTLARTLSTEINAFLDRPEMDLREVVTLVEKGFFPNASRLEEYLNILVQNHPQFDSIYILDKRGTIVSAAPKSEQVKGFSMRGQPSFYKALVTGKVFWASPFMDLERMQLVLPVSVPFHEGTIVGNVNLSSVRQIIQGIYKGRRGFAFMTDETGVVIAHPDERAVSQRVNEKNLDIVRQGLEGKSGTLIYDDQGEKYIGSVAPVGKTGWPVIVTEPVAEAFALSLRLRKSLWVGCGVALIVASCLALWNSGRMLRPLLSLAASTRKVAGGDYASAPFTHYPYRELNALAHDFSIMTKAIRDREQAILHNEEQLSITLDSIVEGVIGTDVSGRITRANPSARELIGPPADRPIGLQISELFPLIDIRTGQVLECPAHAAVREKGVVQIVQDAVFIALNGEKRFIESSAAPIRDKTGEICGAVMVFGDVTARKEAERLSKENEARYRAIVEAFDGVIYICSQDYRVEFMNKRLIERTGHDGTGELCYKVLHERDAICPWCVNERVFKGETVRWEVQSPKDNRWYYVVNTPIHHADGSISKQAMIMDVTERKRAEQALHESERKFRAIFDQTFQFIGLMTVDGTLIEANRTALEFSGVEESDVIGKPFWETPWWIHSQELQERLRAGIKRASDGEFVRFEATHAAADGSLHYVDFSLKPVTDESGNVVLLIPEGRDITERRRAEEEVRRLNAELEQRVVERTAQLETANRELESFSYSVSHDLRAPLRGIDGWSLALLEDCWDRLDERGREHLKRVRHEAQRMGRLIDDLLELSRVTRADMTRKRVDLSDLARSIAERLRNTEPGRKVEFVIHQGLMTYGDTRLLEVMLANLLENAWKFTGKHASARIEFGRTEIEGKTVYFVGDDGAGFDMAYAGKLFGGFQRMHSPSEFPGTGIGLASVQRIIHRHGGRVWAEAAVEKGATFYFTL
jgi:PAS domain S-box-containing protein